VDWIITNAQKLLAADVADTPVYALAAAAPALSNTEPERSRELIAELERLPESRADPYYARQLPTMLRTVLAVGDQALATRLLDGLDPLYPLREHALLTARAQLAEHAGEHAEGARLYAESGARWRVFGNLPETAYALLGEGRCLLTLDRPEAQRPLRGARDLLASMGYMPTLKETESLLEQAAAPTP
jgi:hypothetical protein